MGKELWKVVPGYDLYEVSNFGNIRGKERVIKRGTSAYKRGRIAISGSDNGLGYRRVELNQNGRKKRVYVHRLVAQLFIPNPEHKPFVNHIDNNPGNNRAENLEWCTAEENTAWMLTQGRARRTHLWISRLRETKKKDYKPVIGENLKTGEVLRFEKLNEVKAEGFQPSCVSNCCRGKRTQHKGFKWEYATEEDFT